MSTLIPARLVGGPLDGLEGVLLETPPTVWVSRCKYCVAHWMTSGHHGGHRYLLASLDENGARYEWAELTHGAEPEHVERRELQPA